MNRSAVAGLLVLVASGCGVTDPGECTACPAAAVVSGTVVDRAGAPLSEASVQVHSFEDACGAGDAVAGSGAVLPHTDAGGRFVATVQAERVVVAGCTRLVITHADWPALADTVDLADPLQLRPQQAGSVRDTLDAGVIEAGQPMARGGDGVCAEWGPSHTGTLTHDDTWGPERGPRHVAGRFFIGTIFDRVTLTIRPGTVVCLGAGASIETGGGRAGGAGGGGVLRALGSPASPVIFTASTRGQRWEGITISEMNPAGRSLLSGVVVEHAVRGVIGHGPVDVDSSVIRQIAREAVVFWYYNAAGRLANSVVDSAALEGGAAVGLEGGHVSGTQIRASGGTGISVSPRMSEVRITECDVTGSNGAGIQIGARTTWPVYVHDCNLVDNAGPGVSNVSEVVVDARRNWWGDPAGPTGPAGDGVAGLVDFSETRTAPRAGTASFVLSASSPVRLW